MAMISQKEQLALHEFSVRLRQAIAARNATKDMGDVKDAVREQYEQEQQPSAPQQESMIQQPEIGPSKQPEPEEPEP